MEENRNPQAAQLEEHHYLMDHQPYYCASKRDEIMRFRRMYITQIFTKIYKRHRYLGHKDNSKRLKKVFEWLIEDIDHPERHFRGEQDVLADVTGVPKSTLSTWKSNLREDRNWRPSRDHYGCHKRIFTDEEERMLMQQIREEYLDVGLFYSDQDFRYDAIEFYRKRLLEKLRAAERGEIDPFTPREFRCSPDFIIDFRARWKQSLRRPNFKRRPTVTAEQIQRFKEKVGEVTQKYGSDLVFNMDETNYKLVNNKFMTWACRGTKTINCDINNEVKEGITVLATITKSGTKLPLLVLGKGKTERCLRKFSLASTAWTYYTKSGWTNEAAMLVYLQKLRDHVGRECALVLDTYAAHRCDSVKAKAAELGIELVFIPPGCTDECQPLDRKVFGVLKAYAKQMWRKFYHEHKAGKITKEEIGSQIVEAWDRIGESVIESAWSIYEVEDFADEDYEELENLDDAEFSMIFGVDSEM